MSGTKTQDILFIIFLTFVLTMAVLIVSTKHLERRIDRIEQIQQHQVITEDDPRWDCHTMGNRVCGVTTSTTR